MSLHIHPSIHPADRDISTLLIMHQEAAGNYKYLNICVYTAYSPCHFDGFW